MLTEPQRVKHFKVIRCCV